MNLNELLYDRDLPTLILLSTFGLGWHAPACAQDEDGETHLITHHAGPVSIDGGITWILQASDGAPANTTALSYSLDLGLAAPVSKHGRVVIALEAGDGKGVDPVISPLSNTNYDAFYTNLMNTSPDSTNVVVTSVSQVYYEGSDLDDRLVMSIGKIDVHGKFDDNAYANDETDQFLSAMFVRSPGTSYAELDQYYAPGVALGLSPSKSVDLTFIAANGKGDGFDNVFDSMYLVAQANIKPQLGGRDGNYRFYALSDHRPYTKIMGGTKTSNTALGLSFDQSIYNGVGLFARYSTQDDGIAENIVKSSWSLGALLEGALWGRGRDTAGFGYGIANLNDKANLAAALGTGNTGDESHLEMFYKVGLSQHFTLTADVQLLNNIGGNAAADTVRIAGMRGQINF